MLAVWECPDCGETAMLNAVESVNNVEANRSDSQLDRRIP